MSKPQQPQKDQPKAVEVVPDGRWFQLIKDTFSEARLVEIVVRGGKVVETDSSVDLSRIQLGKLVRRIGETFGEKPAAKEKTA